MPSGIYKRTPEMKTGKHMKGKPVNPNFTTKGTKWSQETRNKIIPKISGENNYQWIKDRTKLQRYNDEIKDRLSSSYRFWRESVYKRDNYKCRIADNNCGGRIEAHHILSYKEFIELRYQINNGITLCHAHHPRKIAEEKRLIPTFTELVSMSVSN
jgi:hypothetical protein